MTTGNKVADRDAPSTDDPPAAMSSLRVRRGGDPAAEAAAAAVDAAVAPDGFLGVEAPVPMAEREKKHAQLIGAGGASGLWVLESATAIVGYATLHEHRPGVLSVGMALLPAARGHGGGRALLDALIEHGGRSGAHKLDLEVWIDNARAIALYSTAGFVVEGIRRDHYRRRDGRLRSSMLMGLRLTGPRWR